MRTKTSNLMIVIFSALLFSLIAFNNISDYHTNFQFVKSVLSMESVKTKNVIWRAVTSPSLQHSVYMAIIIWELITALVCWIGAFCIILTKVRVGRGIATIGLMMGAALFMIGFVIGAGEWFYMWDSDFGTYAI